MSILIAAVEYHSDMHSNNKIIVPNFNTPPPPLSKDINGRLFTSRCHSVVLDRWPQCRCSSLHHRRSQVQSDQMVWVAGTQSSQTGRLFRPVAYHIERPWLMVQRNTATTLNLWCRLNHLVEQVPGSLLV